MVSGLVRNVGTCNFIPGIRRNRIPEVMFERVAGLYVMQGPATLASRAALAFATHNTKNREVFSWHTPSTKPC